MAGRRPWLRGGVALVVGAAAVYVLTSPGRIDMIDGQFRFEAGMNLLVLGRPTLDDPALHFLGVPGEEGRAYARYGVGSALAAAPLLALGFLTDGTDGEVARFLFSLASPLYGAAALGLLLLFYRKLGTPLRKSVGWTLVLAFGTLWWPLAVSSFGQVQHGLLLLLALYGAWRGAVEERWALLVVGGLAGGLLVNYVESYALLLPAVGLAALTPARESEPWRPRVGRYVLFGTVCAAGLAAWAGYNFWRFGDPLFTGRGGTGAGLREGIFGFSTFDNPVEGLLSLLVSPGKGLLLYSLPVVFTLWGVRALVRRAPWVARAVLAATVLHVGLISSLSFHGGDWAWGPRYLVVLLPMWALTWPLVAPGRIPKTVTGLVVGAGVIAQLLGVSIDHQRFFFERDHEPFFWLEDWIYFKESALLARPGEIATSLAEGVPDEARRFSPTPYPRATTYAPFGPNATNEGASQWMRHFQMFYLPRPWPFWMTRLPDERRPFEPVLPMVVLGLVAVGAGAGLWRVLRRASRPVTRSVLTTVSGALAVLWLAGCGPEGAEERTPRALRSDSGSATASAILSPVAWGDWTAAAARGTRTGSDSLLVSGAEAAARGELVRAHRLFRRTADPGPADLDRTAALARIHLVVHDLERADSLARAALTHHPDAPALHAILAETEVYRGRAGEGMERVTVALERAPGHPGAARAAGEFWFRMKEYGRATLQLEAALQSATSWSRPEVYAELAYAAGRMADEADRDRYLDRAREYADRPLVRARLQVIGGEPPAAVASLREAYEAGWRDYHVDVQPVVFDLVDHPSFRALLREMRAELDTARRALDRAHGRPP